MSVQLLDKIHKINKLLQNSSGAKVVFDDLCQVLSGCLNSYTMVISSKCKVLGAGSCPDVPMLTDLISDTVGSHIDPLLNERLLNILSTKENVSLETLGFAGEEIDEYTGIVCPIRISGERLGTMFLYRKGPKYTVDDIILSEYGTTVVGLEFMRSEHDESAEEKRLVQVVYSAISTLSTSELNAVRHIFRELAGSSSGLLVASRIADRAGVNRSVIVNALRKFESAGIIESHSGGMKGTYIKVTNPYLYEVLENYTPE